MRQRYFHDLRAQFLELFNRGIHGLLYLRIQPAHHVFFRQTEFESPDVAVQEVRVMGHWLRHARRVARVCAAQYFQNRGGILHPLAKAANLVER